MVVGLILAGVVPTLFAWLIGLPVLKLKSDYLAIATLGFAEIMRAIIQWNKVGPLTNSSNLLRQFANFDSVLFPFIVSGICIAIIVLIINSTYGRAFKAIRDDEVAAEAMGINLAKHKMQAFLISSFFAGISGALLAMFQFNAHAKNFPTAMTYEILLIVVIGGIGSITGSETTAAAAGAVGVVRRDPMAMLPFCGYNMGDYFKHWIEMGEMLGDKAPKIFNVNWFRVDEDGHFIWPGFGDNLRVLEWILKRCDNEVDAVETAIGYVPKPEDINLEGLKDFDEEKLASILKVDNAKWAKEAAGVEEFYKKFGDKLPQELRDELNGLEERTKA